MKKFQFGQQVQYDRNLQKYISEQSPRKQFKYNKGKAVDKLDLKITDLYEVKQKIGSGSFGQVYKIQHRELKVIRALKSVKKSQKTSSHNPQDQLMILKQLDHPNVLKIYQYLQSQTQWQIVTQYFQGRQLFEQILADRPLSEKKAAKIFSEICKALSYVHSHKIVHRDLKPQNILVKKLDNQQYLIKLIDWGLGSKSVKQLLRKCGTPEYCAPEVIKGCYGIQCDLWSLGVLLYVMLAGKFPFKGSNVKQTLDLVTKGVVNFNGSQWNYVTGEAKSIISKLLRKDPKTRIKASQCLKQPWVVRNLSLQNKKQVKQEANKMFETLQRLKRVHYDNKFQAIVINFVQNYLQSSEQELKLKKQFQLLDQNKDGVLSYQQLKRGYIKIYGQIQTQKIIEQIFLKVDLDNSKQIQYSQFLSFGTKLSSDFTRQQLRQAFKHFDQDKDGKIDRKELSNFLTYEKNVQSAQFDDLIRQIDKDQNGYIDLDQFIQSINKAIQNAKSLQNKTEYSCQQIAKGIIENTKYLKKISFRTLSNCTEKQDKNQQCL